KRLKPLEHILVVCPQWKSRSLKDILSTERMLAYHPGDSTGLRYLEEFNLSDYPEQERLFANENQVLLNLIIQGVGFSVVPREIAEAHIKAGELIVLNQNRSLKIDMALAWYPREYRPDYFDEIIQSIK